MVFSYDKIKKTNLNVIEKLSSISCIITKKLTEFLKFSELSWQKWYKKLICPSLNNVNYNYRYFYLKSRKQCMRKDLVNRSKLQNLSLFVWIHYFKSSKLAQSNSFHQVVKDLDSYKLQNRIQSSPSNLYMLHRFFLMVPIH